MKLQSLICFLGVSVGLSVVHMSCNSGNTSHPHEKERASQIALKELVGGYIVGEALEMDSDRLVYRIHLQNGIEARRVTVEAATGRVIMVEDYTETCKEAVAREENVPHAISLAQRDAAEYAVLQAVPGTVRKWRALRENGRMVFKFDLIDEDSEEKRVTVDARSRDIIEAVPGTLADP